MVNLAYCRRVSVFRKVKAKLRIEVLGSCVCSKKLGAVKGVTILMNEMWHNAEVDFRCVISRIH